MDLFYKWFFLQEGRTPEGYFSAAHLISVFSGLIVFFGLAVLFSILFKNNKRKQDIVLRIASILLVVVYVLEIIEILSRCENAEDVSNSILSNLPLFLCDMSIIIAPIAAFSKGRIKDICCDFLAVWGLVMGIIGNVFAGNIYSSYCVVSWPIMISFLNHTLSGFIALFIILTKKNTMYIRNMPYVFGILTVIMVIANVVALTVPDANNYMFFRGGDGTPYDILYINLFNKNLILYDASVYILQHAFMGLYYLGHHLIVKAVEKHQLKNA